MSNAMKTEIVRLCTTTGLSTRKIAVQLGCSKSYVEDIAAFAGRYRPPHPDVGSDDAKHIRLIALANKGMGFPFCEFAR